jgi:hypothetical protein
LTGHTRRNTASRNTRWSLNVLSCCVLRSIRVSFPCAPAPDVLGSAPGQSHQRLDYPAPSTVVRSRVSTTRLVSPIFFASRASSWIALIERSLCRLFHKESLFGGQSGSDRWNWSARQASYVQRAAFWIIAIRYCHPRFDPRFDPFWEHARCVHTGPRDETDEMLICIAKPLPALHRT